VQLGALADGTYTFWVRAADRAGNCGPAATFVVRIDTQADVPGASGPYRAGRLSYRRAHLAIDADPNPVGLHPPRPLPWLGTATPSTEAPIAPQM
jgi:hypothetical protein